MLGEDGESLGRGITNSRSNYDVACQVALTRGADRRALRARSPQALRRAGRARARGAPRCSPTSSGASAREQYRGQLAVLAPRRATRSSARLGVERRRGRAVERDPRARWTPRRDALFAPGAARKSDFFRDLAGSRYHALAEAGARRTGARLRRPGRRCSTRRSSRSRTRPGREGTLRDARARGAARRARSRRRRRAARAARRARRRASRSRRSPSVGHRLRPRSACRSRRSSIRSEILCHGLGAHAMFPGTRTVLDIGGQDTKAIQVDEHGHRHVVPDERPLRRRLRPLPRLHRRRDEPRPARARAAGRRPPTRTVRINSTCTVFAGAELRERLSLGEKREDILAGLHRAIILRAMSLLARSGGVQRRVHLHRRRGEEPGRGRRRSQSLVARELRRGDDEHLARLDLHGRARRGAVRAARRAGRATAAGREGGRRMSSSSTMSRRRHAPDRRHRRRLVRGQGRGDVGRPRRARDAARAARASASAAATRRAWREGSFDEPLREAGVAERGPRLRRHDRRGRERRVPHRPLLRHDHARPRRRCSSSPRRAPSLDIGALHARAMLMDERGKVLGYRMTSQCASGSGQFLENICRYLGVTLEEIGPLSLAGRRRPRSARRSARCSPRPT